MVVGQQILVAALCLEKDMSVKNWIVVAEFPSIRMETALLMVMEDLTKFQMVH